MTPRTHRRVIWGGALGLLLLLLFVYILGYLGQRSVRNDLRRTRLALERSEFSCPGQASQRIARWGEIGWARYCEYNGRPEGSWQAWEKQRVVIQGTYLEGEKHGTWTWYYPDGTVYGHKTFRHGEEVADEIAADSPEPP
jgi:hypothetical protein